MYKTNEKARKQREEQKTKLFTSKHPRNRLRRKENNRLIKEAEDEVAYLGIQPQHPRDRFRDRVKDKKWHKQVKTIYINRS